MRYLLIILLALLPLHAAHAHQTNMHPTDLLAPWQQPLAASLTCRLMEQEYAQYRRDASGTLNALRFPLYLVVIKGMEPITLNNGALTPDIDYAARALTDDIHDIPQMFTQIGKPYMTDYFASVLKELDHRQQKFCGYAVR